MSYGYDDVGDEDDQAHEGETAHTRQALTAPTHERMSQYEPDESEDDNEIELELTTEYMTNGYADMESDDYMAAEENFRSALELAEEHDFSKKLDYGPGDITLILAECLAKQDKEEEALEMLEPIANGNVGMHYSEVMSICAGSTVDGGQDSVTQLKACHALATIFLKRIDLQAAEKRGQQAFKGRRKICGPHDPETLSSVQLLIDIYTAKNDKTKARAYRRFLEPSTKTKASAKISAVPPILPPVFPSATATLTSPAPTTLETPTTLDTSSRINSTPTVLGVVATKDTPPSPPRTLRSASLSLSSYTSPVLKDLPSTTTQSQSTVIGKFVQESEDEQSTLQLSDSIRAAVQTASTSSTLPASPMVHALRPAVGSLQSTSTLRARSPTLITPESRPSNPSPTPMLLPVSPVNPQVSSARSYSASSATDADRHVPIVPVTPVVAPAFPIAPESTASIPRSGAVITPLSIHVPGLPHPVSKFASPANTIVPRSPPVDSVKPTQSAIPSAAAALYSPSLIEGSSSADKSSLPLRVGPAALPPVHTTCGVTNVSYASTSSPSKLPLNTATYGMISTQPTPVVSPVEIENTANKNWSTTATTSSKVPVYKTAKLTENILPSDFVPPLTAASSYASLATPDPPSTTVSASQAALASIFGSTQLKAPRKSSPLKSTKDCATLSPGKANHASTSVLSSGRPSSDVKAFSSQVAPSLPPYEPTAEIPLFTEEMEDIEATFSSRTFSWLTDSKLAMPLSLARVMSTSPDNSGTSTSTPPDAAPAAPASSANTKRKSWAVQIGRGKGDTSTRKQATLPLTSRIQDTSASIRHTPLRSPSISTLQSVVEPKRHMSLMAKVTSQPLNFLNNDFTSVIERLPRPSMSGRDSLPVQTTPRTRQELATAFAAIKMMRAEGKKSISVEAALKLLREYDPERRILAARESELKKNMRESYKGLASTGYGYAPIHLFCDRKTEAIVEIELLIEQGVDVNAVACRAGAPGHEPFTPLQRAIENGHAEIVRLLVDADVAIAPPRPQKGAPVTTTDTITHPLLIACTKGHTEITYTLLNAGAARLVKEFPHRQWHGNSLLHEACWHADTSMIKMLLDHLVTVKSRYHASAGPDFESGTIGSPGQQDRFGATPIMYAIDLRDCTSNATRMQKSARRKDCLRLLLEHDIHGDLHSQNYRDNIGRVLATKWTRGPGKGHSIFCYCDEASDDELTRLLDPFRYQVPPGMRCHATPQCTSAITGSSIRSGRSVTSRTTDRPIPEFPELMSAPVAWPSSATTKTTDGGGGAAHFELAGTLGMPFPDFDHATMPIGSARNSQVLGGPLGSGVTGYARENENGKRASGDVLSEIVSEVSGRSRE